MSKYLDKVIKEMKDYGNMGMPNGEGAMGMGSVEPIGGLRGGRNGKKVIKAYELNDVLRTRNRAEEEEGMDDYESMDDMSGMDDMEGMDDGGNNEELQQFFTDNPEPSDEEIAMYAEEHDMDLQAMRKAVYSLIQSLLPDSEEGMDDMEGMDAEADMGDEEGLDFSVSGDTGERPAKNEFEERQYGRRSTDRRKF